MKALVLEQQRVLTLQEVPAPEVGEAHELIHIEAVSIGGSEYLGFNNPGIRPIPNIMGHGFTGTTLEGMRVAVYPLLACGCCLYCLTNQEQLCDEWSLIGVHSDGGFAEQASIPKSQIFELPEELSWEQSVFIEPFANSVNAWELSKAASMTSIAIIGAGSLGLGLVALANKSGCSNIHIAELSHARRNAAKTLGATHTSTKLNETYDIVFDTVGSAETRSTTISLAKKGGKCIFLGFENPMHTINMSELIRHQKELKGSFVYSKSQFCKAIELAKNCNSSWVKNISFAEVEDTLTKFIEGDFTHIKVALRPINKSFT
jgi:(R,R)-butanediol dehydrogenase/meso-butanediol dehydrogenase/diacetyl reductase|tara:strand:- start:433 stop:1386 length:954 start_codon:yes stop_codon:yes gene_type:complete